MGLIHDLPVGILHVLSTNFHITEFDQLRAVSPTMDQRLRFAERRLLRRTVAAAAQHARYLLLGITDALKSRGR